MARLETPRGKLDGKQDIALLYGTRLDVPEAARASLVTLLNQRLADMIDLFNQTKYAHWNVKGASFIALHELFDKIAEHVEEHCDLLAEAS